MCSHCRSRSKKRNTVPMATPQWYQTPNLVTVSIKLKGIPPGKITAKFGEQYCAVYVGDTVYWECHLADTIVPDKCKLSVGKVRAELKLKKANLIHWSEYEAKSPTADNLKEEPPPVADVHPPSSHPPPTSLPFSTSHPPPTSLPFSTSHPPPTSLPSSTTTASEKPFVHSPTPLHPSLPPPSPPTLPLSPPVNEDLTYLNHMPHDCVDRGGDVVVVKVGVGGVEEGKCQVTFRERTLEIRFQTSDQKFLRTCSGSGPSDTFIWGMQLYDEIVPSESSFSIKPTCVELRLKKASSVRWKALERPQHSPGITVTNSNSSQLTNHVQKHSHQPTNQNADDSMLNDLSVDSNSSPHPNSHATTFKQHNDVTMMSQQRKEPYSSVPQGGSYPSSSPSSTLNQTSAYSSQYPPTTPKLSPSQIPPAAMETTDPSYRYNQLRRPSYTGLCNFANNCFMNSVVQCLSNTRELRDYFIEGRYLADINTTNPLGFKGELAKCFSGIIRKLWSGEYEYFPPVKLKQVIASRSSTFGGYQQHDSHEFMSYLLDGLHEDLNRVRSKPLTSPVELEDCPDQEVAEESWRVYRLRNNSYFVDHFQGQFKSTLVCPDCSKVSMTFDPFMSLSVPIPRNLRHLPVIFVPRDPSVMPIEYILKLPPEARLELLKASVARKTGIPMTHLRVFEAYNGKFQTLLSSNLQPIKSIGSNDIIIVSEVLSRREAGDEVVEINVIQRVQLPIFPTKCSTCGRLAKKGKKLMRCSKCKAVGYCDTQCQSKDWSEHRLKCRGGRPVPVGLPFVVSLPAKQLTYTNLASVVEKMARHSVKIERRPESKKPHDSDAMQSSSDSSLSSNSGIQENTGSTQDITESAQENTETIQTNGDIAEPMEALSIQESTEESNGSIQESTSNMQEPANGMQESTQVSTESMQEYTEGVQESTQVSTESTQEYTEGVQERAMYTLTPVDRYGDSVEGATPLEDKGDEVITIGSKFLAMDWSNTKEGCVTITPKPTMDCRRDPTSSATQSGPITLEQCLELFTEPETLSKEEAWYCSRCKDHCEATKQLSVWRLPRVLIVHLKRFSFANFIWRDKINELVTFPLRGLDMSPYMLEATQRPDNPPIYDLYAVVNHYGSGYQGHYAAVVKPPTGMEPRTKNTKNTDWLCYDDDRVFRCSKDEVVSKYAYILFYCRRDCR